MSNRNVMTFRSVMKGYVEHVRNGVNLNDSLFQLSKACNDVTQFLRLCREQEEWVTSPEANQTRMDRIPDAWVQAKSNIKRAWEKGLDPNAYPSLSKYRKAKAAVEVETGTITKQGLAPSGSVLVEVTQQNKASIDDLPADLRTIAKMIAPLPELSRKRCVVKMKAIAEQFRADHDGNMAEGDRRRSRSTGRVVNV